MEHIGEIMDDVFGEGVENLRVRSRGRILRLFFIGVLDECTKSTSIIDAPMNTLLL